MTCERLLFQSHEDRVVEWERERFRGERQKTLVFIRNVELVEASQPSIMPATLFRSFFMPLPHSSPSFIHLFPIMSSLSISYLPLAFLFCISLCFRPCPCIFLSLSPSLSGNLS